MLGIAGAFLGETGILALSPMSNRTRNLHAWKTRTDDGRRRQVRAQLFASRWTLSSRCEDEENWTRHDPPLLEDLVDLHEVLFNKYQRKHLAWEHVVGVQRMIEARSPRL